MYDESRIRCTWKSTLPTRCKECRKPVINECIEANKDKINANNRERMGLQMVITVLGRFATYKAGVSLGLSFQII